MAGFSALMLSGFTSIRFFGYLVIISIGSCLAGALVLIPAILLRFRPGFVEKDMSSKRNKIKEPSRRRARRSQTKNKKNEKANITIGVISAAFAGIGTAAGRRADNE
jgi:predicted RND superfamily exporter protein